MSAVGARQCIGVSGGKRLPYDAKVEYLQLSGTQYINSGLKVSSTLGVEITAAFTAFNAWLFGGRTAYHNSAFGVYRDTYGNVVVNYGNTSPTVYSGVHTNVNVYSLMQNVYSVNGTVAYTFTAQTFSSNSPLYIGNLSIDSQGTPASVGFVGRMYGCKIYQGGIIVAEMIPVRFTNELVQSEGAMYDKVSGRLFRNAGTGTFTIGPDKS